MHLRSIISIIKQKGWNLENENLHLKLMSRIYYLLQLSTSDGVHKWSPLLYIVEVHAHIAPSPKASVLRGSEKNCWKVPSTSKNIQYRLSNLGGFKINYKKKVRGKGTRDEKYVYHRTLRNSEEGGPKNLGMGWERKEENCDCEEGKSWTQAVKLEGEFRFGSEWIWTQSTCFKRGRDGI